MVSSVLFFRLNHRLIDTFGCDSEKVFTGIPVIVCGDLYRVSPVTGNPIYSTNSARKELVTFDFWQLFGNHTSKRIS